MRALVLILLGGAVLYLVWYGFEAVDAKADGDAESADHAELAGRPAADLPASPADTPASRADAAGSEGQVGGQQASGTGRMISPQELQAAMAEDGIPAGEPQGVLRGGRGSSEPAGPEPKREPEPSERVSYEWSDLGDLVAQGSLLLHDVERLPEQLAGPWRELSEGRKALLFAYASLLRGVPQSAEQAAAVVDGAADVTAAERDLLRSALDGGRPRPLAASTRQRISPLLLAVRMGLLAREAAADLGAGRHQEAAETLSALLLEEIEAPWPADRETLAAWSEQLARAQAGHRWSEDGDWASIEVQVAAGESMDLIRRRTMGERPGLYLSNGLLKRANQVGKYIHPGDTLRIPLDPVRVLVDLSSYWVFYLHGEEVVAAWEVAIGRDGKTTPGEFTVGEMLEEPPWFRPGGPLVPYGDPENPLGTRWIAWEGSHSLGFHGTWEPETIGSPASDGCVRLCNAEVEELFEILPRKAPVRVQP